MERATAFEKLGLKGTEDQSIIQSKYNEMYNDYRLMIENAPTPKLRESFERNLQELEEAYALIQDTQEQTAVEAIEDLPVISRVETASRVQSKSGQEKTSKVKLNVVYEYFGCSESQTDREIKSKYIRLINTLEQEVKKQILPQARKIYEDELKSAKDMWSLLLTHRPSLEAVNVSSAIDMGKMKKYLVPAFIVVVVAIAIGFLYYSGAFKGSAEEDFINAQELVKKGDIKSLEKAEVIFTELMDNPDYQSKVNEWIEKVREQKNLLINDLKADYRNSINNNQFIEATMYWDDMNSVFEVTDPDMILEFEDVKLKAKSQKVKVSSYIKEAKKAEKYGKIQQSIDLLLMVKEINPSNIELDNDKLGKLEKLKQKYKSCEDELVDINGALSISSPGEELYRIATEKRNEIKKRCPGLFANEGDSTRH